MALVREATALSGLEGLGVPEVVALTVRAEVYALGATLTEALARRGSELDDEMRLGLVKIAARATEENGASRFPSVDELASALRRVAGLAKAALREESAWPVLG